MSKRFSAKEKVELELIFLGTGAGVPSRQRNVAAMVLELLAENGSYWLFDCGEGTQQQIMRSSIRLSKLNKLFITHLHGDHIFGIPGLISSRSNQGTLSPLTIYGPVGIKAYVEMALAISQSRLIYPIEIIEYNEGRVYADDLFQVEVIQVEHRIESFGFRIIERNKPGKLDVEKLKAMGLESSPLFGQLKQGKTVELADGRVLQGKNFIGPELIGRKIAIVGDTRRCNAAVRLAQDVDLLVHEATFSLNEQDLAELYYHSTTVDAASIAVEANAKALVMTHFSSRYQEEDMPSLLNEAKQKFANSFTAEDYASFVIPLIQ
jgi:ribonuclease Z